MALRSRNAALLAKIETTEGVDASPVAGTDAVLVENPQISFNPNTVQTNEVTGSLDGRGPITGGMTVRLGRCRHRPGMGKAAEGLRLGGGHHLHRRARRGRGGHRRHHHQPDAGGRRQRHGPGLPRHAAAVDR